MVKCNKNNTNNSCRSFKIVDSSVGYQSPPTSYFRGKTPGVVAKKFGSMLFRLVMNNPSYMRYKETDTIDISIQETTHGSNRALYCYTVKKTMLDRSITRTLPNGRQITNRFKTSVFKCERPSEKKQLFTETVLIHPLQK